MKYIAEIVKNEQVIIASAEKSGSTWMIGGDIASASTELGYQIFIYDLENEKMYWLKGNRMIFQDMIDENKLNQLKGGVK